jgi:hypothetical protein
MFLIAWDFLRVPRWFIDPKIYTWIGEILIK